MNKLEKLARDFYDSEDVSEIVEQVKKSDSKGKESTIKTDEGLSFRQIDFLYNVTQLRYIDTCEIAYSDDQAYAELKLNGRFVKSFDNDMQREKKK